MREPQSRQYSWPGSAGDPQEGQASGGAVTRCLFLELARLLRVARGGGAAVRAEERVRGQRVPALGAGDDRPLAGGPAAVRAEVRSPWQRRTALAAPRRDAPARGGEHLVELVEPRVDPEQLVAAFGEQVLAEAVTPVHLEHQAAEIAEP